MVSAMILAFARIRVGSLVCMWYAMPVRPVLACVLHLTALRPTAGLNRLHAYRSTCQPRCRRGWPDRHSATWYPRYAERRTLASCRPPSSPSIGGWLKGGCHRDANPISVPPRCPSWLNRRAPVSNVLRWDSGASATCSGYDRPKQPPLQRETCKYPAWLPSSLRKWGGRRKRDLWAAGQPARLLISWLWWIGQRIRHSRSRSEEHQDWKEPLRTCRGIPDGANFDGTRSGGAAVRRATTGVPTSGSSYGGDGGGAFKRRWNTPLDTPRYTDPEVVEPLLLLVAEAGDFVGSVLEIPLGDLWPEAMYAKETVAIKDLVKRLGTVPAANARAPKQGKDGTDDESSGSYSSESSSESSGSSLASAGSGTAAAKRNAGKSTMGTTSGKRAGGTFVVGAKSAAGRRPRGGGTKRKRGPTGASTSKSTGGATSVKPAPRRWRLPVVGNTVRVHGPVPGGPKVVLGGGSIGSRPAAGGRLRGLGADGSASPAGRPQKMPRRGERSGSSRPVGESAGGEAGAGGVVWKFKPRGEYMRNPITL